MNDIDRINSLRTELDYHNHCYYVKDLPKISDFEFDSLLNELNATIKTTVSFNFDKEKQNFT